MTDDDTDPGLGSMEVAETAGLAYQTLHRWCAAGAVRPSIADADGTGTRRRWSNLDRDTLADIAAVYDDWQAIDFLDVVHRLWVDCHRDPDSDTIELDLGSITVTVDRWERRAVQARHREILVRRGLEEQ